MFLSDISYLQRLNSTRPVSGLESLKGSNIDQYEVELERLYAGSPLITEWSATYTLGELYRAESEEGFKKPLDNSKTLTPINFLGGEKLNEPLDFSPREVKKVSKDNNNNNNNDESPLASSVQVSGLSQLIIQNEKEFSNGSNKGKMRLTIYLPDFSDILVYASMDCTIGELIKIILKQHENEALDPPLDYRNHTLYELRMHEGDGEPDRDFPAYPWDQMLRNTESDEFCLCMKEYNADFRTYSVNESLFAPPPLPLTSSEKSSVSSHRIRDRERGGLDTYSTPASRFSEDLDEPPQMENSVMLKFPDGQSLTIEHDEEATLKDLLPKIAESHRIRLFTDEYEFIVSPQDQKMLSLMSPVIDIDCKIYNIGTRIFDIQKKMYSDAGKLSRLNQAGQRASRKRDEFPNLAGMGIGMNRGGNNNYDDDNISITFTEATANAYQQWNVVKKNKFGIKQERIFGVDGKKVYNAKRGQLRGGANSGVQRAERDISSIVKIEKLPQDNKTFRITWMDNGDIYYIEYTCETTRECSEIVAKIKYLLNRNHRK